MSTSPTTIDDITPAWLTGYLRVGGYLSDGEIREIIWHDPKKAWSGSLTPMELRCSFDVPPTVQRLIFKQWHSSWAKVAAHELYFYTTIAPQTPQIRVPHLYYQHQTATSACAIFEDFSSAYQILDVESVLSIAAAQSILNTLAAFHAHWWDSPQLQDIQLLQPQSGPLCMAHLSTPEVLRAYDRRLRENAPQFIAAFGTHLSSAWREAFEWTIEHWLSVAIKRVSQARHLTLIHGDVHCQNLAFRRADVPELMLFDWETHKRGLGAYDVAYFLHNTYWGDHRKQHEMALLRYYYGQLVEYGVVDYSWELFLADYRLAVLTLLLVHLQWRAMGFDHPVDFIQDSMDGFEMWGCKRLLR